MDGVVTVLLSVLVFISSGCACMCACVDPPISGNLNLNLSAPPGAYGAVDASEMVLVQVWFFVGLLVCGNVASEAGGTGVLCDSALSSLTLGLPGMSVPRNQKFNKHTRVFQQ